MSVSAETLRLLMEAGLSGEQLLAVVVSMEAAKPALSKGAERTRKWRENKARDVTVTSPETRHGDVSHVGERAQVVTPSLPSLRSEELKKPPEKTSSSTPKGAKTKGSRRVPTSWIPGKQTLSALEAEGHTPGDLERALTRMRDHEFRVPRTDWDAAFRNWVRNDADRKPRNERSNHPQHPTAREDRLGRMLRGAMAAVDEREADVG